MVKNKFLFLFIFILNFLILKFVFGLSSTNFQIPQSDAGPSREVESISPNFKIESFMGDQFRGESVGPNFKLDHGFFYTEDQSQNIRVSFKIIPEKRTPSTGNNSTKAILIIRLPNSSTIVYKSQLLIETDNNGYSQEIMLNNVNPGIYDLYVKGFSHLYIKKAQVALNYGSNFVDFSNGGIKLALAGDTNIVNQNDPLKEGDNYVNSIDIGVVVNKLFQTSNIEKEDLNKDGVVNSIDIGITTTNLFKYGDTP